MLLKGFLNKTVQTIELSGQLINYNKSVVTTQIGRKKKTVFGSLIDRVEHKLQTWNMQVISKAGKLKNCESSI